MRLKNLELIGVDLKRGVEKLNLMMRYIQKLI